MHSQKKNRGPEVLAYRNLDDPQPKANQVLIRVHSAGLFTLSDLTLNLP